jgi:hypothetical protein
LPNGSKLPTAGSFAESIWRNLPSSGRIFSPSWTHQSDSLPYQILVLTLPKDYLPACTWSATTTSLKTIVMQNKISWWN